MLAKYKIFFISLIIAPLIASGLTACKEDSAGNKNRPGFDSAENYISGILISLPESRAGEDVITGNGNDTDTEPDEIDGWEVIKTNRYDLSDLKEFDIKFDETTTVFVSQMTSSIPAFQNDDVTYAYSHIPNTEDATWEDGYNFTPSSTDTPLEWYKIGNGGTYHGGFSLYALLFPLENEIREKRNDDGSQITYSVMPDQRNREDLIKSDILGGFHSTAELFSRLRFRLFHMMSYIRVRLYVPVYDETTRTGFPENAIEYATLDNVTTEFGVEWRASISSDTDSPLLVPMKGDGKIFMYQHPLADGKDGHDLGLVKYKDFIGNYYDQGITGEYDKVRIYDFSVLLPMQKERANENDDTPSFLNTQFLNFYIRSSSGATTRYYFSQDLNGTTGTESSNTDENSGSVQIEQGKIQYLQLYVPRVGNKIVFVSAKVNPWKQRSTSLAMTQTPE